MKKTEIKDTKALIREAKMKNSEPITIPFSELQKGGVYLTHTKDLIQIREIDVEKITLEVFNMTEQCKQWIDGKKHIIVERKR